MSTRIQLRGDVSTNWVTFNPVLAAREVGIETDSDLLKIGDGTTPWVGLPYAGGGAVTSVNGLIGAITLSANDVGAVPAGSLAAVASSGAYSDLLGAPTWLPPRSNTLTAVGNTYTPNSDSTDVAVLTTPGGDFTVANPIGSPADGQRLILRITSGNSYTSTWGAQYQSSGVAAVPSSPLPSNRTVTYGFMFDAAAGKWVLLAADGTGY